MMLTNRDLVAFVKAMVGQPYWYGTCVYKCTSDLLLSKANQYPSHYKSGRTPTYNSHIKAKKVCADCIGLIKGFFWTNGGEGVLDAIGTDKTFDRNYEGNGVEDRSANGFFNWCKSEGADWGEISNIPEVEGLVVHRDEHIGVYIGKGKAIEARGFAHGIVETNISERDWESWAYIPDTVLTYYNSVISEPSAPSETTYIVQKGDTLSKIAKRFGTTVAKLQEANGAILADPDRIQIGWVLTIPKQEAPSETLRDYEAIGRAVVECLDDIRNLESYENLKKVLGE